MQKPPRKEPTFNPENRPKHTEEAQDGPELERSVDKSLTPTIRLTLYAVAALCLFILGERILDRYQRHLAIQALNEQLEAFDEQMEQMSAEQAARARATRERRAQTSTGQWLAKNCSDWQRSYESMQTQTARDEMRAKCRAYERFLETGVAPAGAPR